MTWFLILPFIAQAVAMGFDEFRFHRRRVMPRWERIGHPVDSLLVLVCLAYVLLVPYSLGALKGYLVLVAISCLGVTKDEWMHKRHCVATEHWLHAVQFVLHPLMLLSAAVMWPVVASHDMLSTMALDYLLELSGSGPIFHNVLTAQFLLTLGFMVYQVVYWNIDRRWDPEMRKAQPTRKLVP
jgi:hypothetical protein